MDAAVRRTLVLGNLDPCTSRAGMMGHWRLRARRTPARGTSSQKGRPRSRVTPPLFVRTGWLWRRTRQVLLQVALPQALPQALPVAGRDDRGRDC